MTVEITPIYVKNIHHNFEHCPPQNQLTSVYINMRDSPHVRSVINSIIADSNYLSSSIKLYAWKLINRVLFSRWRRACLR